MQIIIHVIQIISMQITYTHSASHFVHPRMPLDDVAQNEEQLRTKPPQLSFAVCESFSLYDVWRSRFSGTSHPPPGDMIHYDNNL